MNQLMMIVVVVVLFCYFGGKYCPSVLKKNKEILLGVAGGLVLCSFFGLRLEGFMMDGLELSLGECYSRSGAGGAAWSEGRRSSCDAAEQDQADGEGQSVGAQFHRAAFNRARNIDWHARHPGGGRGSDCSAAARMLGKC